MEQVAATGGVWSGFRSRGAARHSSTLTASTTLLTQPSTTLLATTPARTTDDLPLPEGPRIATKSPAATSQSIPFSTARRPSSGRAKDFLILRSRIILLLLVELDGFALGQAVSDLDAVKMSSEIAAVISEEMTFPGQIKVTVIRASESVSVAS